MAVVENNASRETGIRAITGKWRPGLQGVQAGPGYCGIEGRKKKKNGGRDWIADS